MIRGLIRPTGRSKVRAPNKNLMLRRIHFDHGPSLINLMIHYSSRHKKKNKSGNITQSTHVVYEGIAGNLLRKKNV